MKLYKVFQLILGLSLVTASLSGCRPTRPTFQSDEQLKANFQQQKAQMLTLMQKCKSEQQSQLLKRDTQQSFSECVVNDAQLKSMNVKEIAVESRIKQLLLPDFQGNRVLFATDYYKDEWADTFVEEKGYLYAPTSLQQDVIQTGSLDQFASQYSIEKRKNETWRYKQIEPNWYLYYRQYYYPYLG